MGGARVALGGRLLRPEQTMWFLAWMPRALAEGTNPLLTDRLNAPDGANLMWNTAVPLIALAVAPVTPFGAPILAYDVALAGAVAMSGLASSWRAGGSRGGFAGPLVGGAGLRALSRIWPPTRRSACPLVAGLGPPLFLVLLHGCWCAVGRDRPSSGPASGCSRRSRS